MISTLLVLMCAAEVPQDAMQGAVQKRRSPVVEVVERAGPAVVNIASQMQERNPFRQHRRASDDFFREFMGSPEADRSRQSLGSGVIIDPSGLVLTNEHVISQATNITITLADRRTFEVDVVGADPSFDLAVLKVRGQVQLPTVELGSSGDLMIGETVVAIGNPFGLANTVTTGVVSALHRSIEAEKKVYEDFIQTDAAINPGNSGGALLNIEGKLIGINTAIYSGGTGIGFAIPVDKAKAAVAEVIRYGEVRPAFSGLIVDGGSSFGAIVRGIHPDSPAADSGIVIGDRIIDVGGQEVKNGRAFHLIERSLVPGQTMRLTAVRKSGRGMEEKVKIDLTVKELSFERAAAIGKKRLGLEIGTGKNGLIIQRVAADTDAARVGIRKGDILLSIGGKRLGAARDFELMCAAIRDADAVAVIIGREGRAYYVTLRLSDI
jgi:serine protease Do